MLPRRPLRSPRLPSAVQALRAAAEKAPRSSGKPKGCWAFTSNHRSGDIEIELFMLKPRRGWNGASLDRDASDDDRARPAGTDSSAGPQPPAGTWRARPAPARAAQTAPGAYRGRPPGVRRWRRRGTRPEHHCRLAAWSPSFARLGASPLAPGRTTRGRRPPRGGRSGARAEGGRQARVGGYARW
jgi:hypothetical protein